MSGKEEIVEEGNLQYLRYAAADAAAFSPGRFVAAVGHDIGKHLLEMSHVNCMQGNETAAEQFHAERSAQVIAIAHDLCVQSFQYLQNDHMWLSYPQFLTHLTLLLRLCLICK